MSDAALPGRRAGGRGCGGTGLRPGPRRRGLSAGGGRGPQGARPRAAEWRRPRGSGSGGVSARPSSGRRISASPGPVSLGGASDRGRPGCPGAKRSWPTRLRQRERGAACGVPTARRARAGTALGRWVLLLLSRGPSLGTLGAPLISDDAAALGYAHRAGPFADWTAAPVRDAPRALLAAPGDHEPRPPGGWTGTAPAPAAPLQPGGPRARPPCSRGSGAAPRRGRGRGAGRGRAGGDVPRPGRHGDLDRRARRRPDRARSSSAPLWLALGAAGDPRAAAAAFLACASKEVGAARAARGRAAPRAGRPRRTRRSAARGPLAAAALARVLARRRGARRRAALGLSARGSTSRRRSRAGAGLVLAAARAALLRRPSRFVAAGARRAPSARRARRRVPGRRGPSLLPLLPLLAGRRARGAEPPRLFLCRRARGRAGARAARCAAAPRRRRAGGLLAVSAASARRARLGAPGRHARVGRQRARGRGARRARARARRRRLPSPLRTSPCSTPRPRARTAAPTASAWGLAERFRAPFEPAAAAGVAAASHVRAARARRRARPAARCAPRRPARLAAASGRAARSLASWARRVPRRAAVRWLASRSTTRRPRVAAEDSLPRAVAVSVEPAGARHSRLGVLHRARLRAPPPAAGRPPGRARAASPDRIALGAVLRHGAPPSGGTLIQAADLGAPPGRTSRCARSDPAASCVARQPLIPARLARRPRGAASAHGESRPAKASELSRAASCSKTPRCGRRRARARCELGVRLEARREQGQVVLRADAPRAAARPGRWTVLDHVVGLRCPEPPPGPPGAPCARARRAPC